MKLSVITVNYNNYDGLKETISSVIYQLTKEVEFIIIDGGSNDGSQDLLEQNTGLITYWVSEKDEGIYHAQNKGIEASKGEYCLFLNSGDILAGKGTIEKILKDLHTEDILYGDLITKDAKGKKQQMKSPGKLDIHHFMVSTLWHPTTLIHRRLFERYGKYEQQLRLTGDYEFFIRVILKFGVTTRHLDYPICIFDLTGISNSEEWAGRQEQERKLSWQLNFSDIMISTFEKWTQLQRSREYKIYKLFHSVTLSKGK